MLYTHIARKGPAGVTSPLDLLSDIPDGDLRAAAAANQGSQRVGVWFGLKCCTPTALNPGAQG